MQNIDSAASLKEAIRLLEIKREEERILLKEQVRITKEGLRPMNLAKDALSGIVNSQGLRNGLVDTGIGLLTGYLTKRTFLGVAKTPITRIAGGILQFAVTTLVSKYSGGLREAGAGLLKRFMNRKEKPEVINEDY